MEGISGDCFVQTSIGPCRVRDLVDKSCKLWFDGATHAVEKGFIKITSGTRVSIAIKGGPTLVLDREQRVAMFGKSDDLVFMRAGDLQKGDKLLFPTQFLQRYERETEQKKVDFATITANKYMEYVANMDSGAFRMNMSSMLSFVKITKQDDVTGNSQLEIAVQSIEEACFLQMFLGFFGVMSKVTHITTADTSDICLVVQNQYATEYIRLCSQDYMKTFLDAEMKSKCRDVVKNRVMADTNCLVLEDVQSLEGVGDLYYPQVEKECSYVVTGGIVVQAKAIQ